MSLLVRVEDLCQKAKIKCSMTEAGLLVSEVGIFPTVQHSMLVSEEKGALRACLSIPLAKKHEVQGTEALCKTLTWGFSDEVLVSFDEKEKQFLLVKSLQPDSIQEGLDTLVAASDIVFPLITRAGVAGGWDRWMVELAFWRPEQMGHA